MENEIIHRLEEIGIVPVVVLDREEDAPALAKALTEGGLPCAEVTFRTAAAKNAIRAMRSAYPDMLVGAGTVLSTGQAADAIEAGAQFIVSPGINPKVVNYCRQQNVCVIPGCANPSNVETALELGLSVVKFFPAQQAGGIEMLKAMSGPYPKVRFMPTGGINEKNMNDYLAFSKVVACGGSYMVKKELIADGKFQEITSLTQKAVAAMLAIQIEKAGNENGKNTLLCSADNLERLVYHLSQQGFVFDQKSAQYKKEQLVSIRAASDSGAVICFRRR